MGLLNMFFGLITIGAFIFAIYQRYEIKKHALTEQSKILIQAEKLNAVYEALRSVGSSVDMIVQVPKRSEVTVQELQNIARSARSNVYVTMKLIKGQKKRLDEWQYGKMLVSNPFDANVENSHSKQAKQKKE